MRLSNLSREKWRDQTTLKNARYESALDGGTGGVHPQRYYKVFEFTVPTLVAPDGKRNRQRLAAHARRLRR